VSVGCGVVGDGTRSKNQLKLKFISLDFPKQYFKRFLHPSNVVNYNCLNSKHLQFFSRNFILGTKLKKLKRLRM
jgi:hypothetical protein